MFKRFINYYKDHKLIFALDMLASFAVSLIGLIYPILTRKMLNDLIPNRLYNLIIIYGFSLLGLYLIRFLLNYFIQYYGHIMGVYIQAKMRSDLFAHLQNMSFSFYDNHKTGKIMTRMTDDLFEIAELAHHGPENIIISFITLVISFIYLLTINVPLSLIIFAMVPFLVLIANKIRKKHLENRRLCRKAISEINGNLQNSISGIRVTKAFTNSENEQEKFEIGNKMFIDASKKQYKTMAQFNSVTSLITDVFNVVVLLAGGIFLYNGQIDFADYSAFILSVSLFISPINRLIMFMEQLQSGITGFERYCEIMDISEEQDLPDSVDIKDVKGNIKFENVSSAYENQDVLKDVNLDIKAGETFALVGPSGGGKTTICHLIARFYPVSSGKITIDGQDISKITSKSLRENIGIVQQDVYLFDDTIENNIRYGNLSASKQQVIEAAKKANIDEYINSLPDGYQTMIGERGVKLSGGQKQRLSIARVFLKNPAILILDEATSALDNSTELMIQKALDSLSKDRTTIVVAHRLSTIKNAGRIAYVNDGIIVEQGDHKSLIEKKGEYYKLYQQQFGNN